MLSARIMNVWFAHYCVVCFESGEMWEPLSGSLRKCKELYNELLEDGYNPDTTAICYHTESGYLPKDARYIMGQLTRL